MELVDMKEAERRHSSLCECFTGIDRDKWRSERLTAILISQAAHSTAQHGLTDDPGSEDHSVWDSIRRQFKSHHLHSPSSLNKLELLCSLKKLLVLGNLDKERRFDSSQQNRMRTFRQQRRGSLATVIEPLEEKSTKINQVMIKRIFDLFVTFWWYYISNCTFLSKNVYKQIFISNTWWKYYLMLINVTFT